MKLGIPKGLLYYKYHIFVEVFFSELGAEIITSENTNQRILDIGTSNCIDEACLPIKIFHGHVGVLIEQCDVILLPRIMSIYKNEYICPKFCGLPEMINSSFKNLNTIPTKPIYASSAQEFYKWCNEAAHIITTNQTKIKTAFSRGMLAYKNRQPNIDHSIFKFKIGLIGHPYNLQDKFINMNIIDKLRQLGIGVITEDSIDETKINKFTGELFKKPFWTFARRNYGLAVYLATNKLVDGIIYISSFSCGIDSIVIELIKNRISEIPIMILKLDEQTGDIGFNTRIEAFSDMLERRIG